MQSVPDLVFRLFYVAGLVAQVIIRAPIARQRRQNKIVTDLTDRQEWALLWVLLLGMFILPVLFLLTPWLKFANYRLRTRTALLGMPLMGGALYLFWRSHVDLGRDWSPTLEIREGHRLVTNGVYTHIRHPMYASQWLFAAAQALLLQNWIAGLSGIVCFLPLYIFRVPKEEQMLIDAFGEEYRADMRRTGRVLPRIRA
jgi:protein-S-isoprenylcysteine O-methyltransferase Ste14